MGEDTAADAWRQLAHNFRLFRDGPGRERVWVAVYSAERWSISEHMATWRGEIGRQLRPDEYPGADARMCFREWARRATLLLSAAPRPVPADDQWLDILRASVDDLPELGSFIDECRIVNVCEASALFCEWRALQAETAALVATLEKARAPDDGAPVTPALLDVPQPDTRAIADDALDVTARPRGPDTPSARKIETVLTAVVRDFGVRATRADIARAAGYTTTRQLEDYQREALTLSAGTRVKFERALSNPEAIAALARERIARME